MRFHRSLLRVIPPWRLRKFQRIYVRKKIGGGYFAMPVTDGLGLENLKFKSSWKTQIIRLLVDPHDGLFVDVGANVGQTLLDLQVSHRGKPYLGFEPNLNCVAYLNDLIDVNSFDGCQILPIGLHSEHQILAFYRREGKRADPCATVVPDLRPDQRSVVSYVPVFPMSSVTQAISHRRIDFVKIDIEGGEDQALYGMEQELKSSRPLILCEVLFANRNADALKDKERKDKIFAFLQGLDYRVFQVLKSEDNSRVVDVTEISEFSDEVWNQSNADMCDYLFVPTDRCAQVKEKLQLRQFPG